MARSKPDRRTGQLFRSMSGQDELFEKSYEEELETRRGQSVECLGMTFESDEARREHFLEKLKEKLPELRQRPDFPIGDDEDILRLSDPPYYTACPNPFLAEFVKCHGRPYDPEEPYHCEPFAVDVSEGKTDPLYKAHGYHTKVPHRAIVPSILHYTKPGDIVLDGFCGSGMTGVAAQWCGTAPPAFRKELEQRWRKEGREAPEWGSRRVILGDLSPASTFIAANYNIPFDLTTFSRAAAQLLKEVESEIGWMYETLHTDGKTKGRINYTVWSEVFSCPECTGEVVFLKEAFDPKTKRVNKSIECPHCSSIATKEQMDLQFESFFDTSRQCLDLRPKRLPVIVNYTVGKAKYEKEPDGRDFELLKRIADLEMPAEVPVVNLPDCQMTRVGRMRTTNTRCTHHMFLPRAIHALAAMWHRADGCEDHRLRNMLLFFVEQAVWTMSLLNRFRPSGYSQVNQYLSGVFYVPSQHAEVSLAYVLSGKLKRLVSAFSSQRIRDTTVMTSVADCARTLIPDDSIDYVFTDPPFGENIYYADLNYLVESWHRILTRSEPEAIVDRAKNKGISNYQHLMQRCFEEYRRVLKPGRWMTVVFHNSKNAVWNAIQEAMLAAGFVVADIRTLDKQQGSYRQVTSTAVKQDLVISAYKPNHGLEERFKLEAGTENGVWDFVRTHMRQLPVFVSKNGQAEVIAERQNYLLFDRMVAFHVQRGVTVPLSAVEFYTGLEQRFPSREGMYFLPEQAAEYDKKRMTVKEVLQIELFVLDEASAIQWLRQQLTRKPQTFQDIHPRFLKEIGGWRKHEKLPELSEMLEQNFLRYDGKGEVPARIHSYLSTNFKDLRNRPKDDPMLQAKAKDRWYVPDPNKAGDLEKLRERALLNEFKEYKESRQRRLKVFRLEAVRAGFKKAWQERDYKTIIAVASKIPEKILQEDPKLLMWYDQAVTRTTNGHE